MNLDQVRESVEKRIVPLEITCLSFKDDDTKKIILNVLDVCKSSIESAFEELLCIRFPIYTASCHNLKPVGERGLPSLHAFGTAVDINYLMNPFYNVVTHSIIPGRNFNRKLDSENITLGLIDELKLPRYEELAVLSAVIQEEGSDDWFLNRNIVRRGMLTIEHADIFKKNGFDIWGGLWRQPMDFMHFQCSRTLAESLVKVPKEEACSLWEKHLDRL